jgi:hypothetical protein
MSENNEHSERTDLTDLLEILFCERKGDLKKLCRSKIITSSAFAEFILASMAGATPWDHRRHHRQFTPEHLIPGPDEHLSLTKKGAMTPAAQKFMRKISVTFAERRLLSGHLFFNADLSNWHLIYFDQRDMADRGNHWNGGSHIHLINHLWPQWTAQSIWDAFRSDKPAMVGAMHIRYDREERQSQGVQGYSPRSRKSPAKAG